MKDGTSMFEGGFVSMLGDGELEGNRGKSKVLATKGKVKNECADFVAHLETTMLALFLGRNFRFTRRRKLQRI